MRDLGRVTNSSKVCSGWIFTTLWCLHNAPPLQLGMACLWCMSLDNPHRVSCSLDPPRCWWSCSFFSSDFILWLYTIVFPCFTCSISTHTSAYWLWLNSCTFCLPGNTCPICWWDRQWHNGWDPGSGQWRTCTEHTVIMTNFTCESGTSMTNLLGETYGGQKAPDTKFMCKLQMSLKMSYSMFHLYSSRTNITTNEGIL